MELLPSRAPLCFRLQLQRYNTVSYEPNIWQRKASLQFELLTTYYSKSPCKMSYTPYS